MKHRKAVNCLLLCAGACMIIVSNIVDIPILDWLGDALLFAGVIMLPKTASIDRMNRKKEIDS